MPQVLGRGQKLSVDLSPSQTVPEMTTWPLERAGVLENRLFTIGAKTVLQHAALGLQRWLEDRGNGRDVSLQLSFHWIPEQRLTNQRHKPQSEEGWADSPN